MPSLLDEARPILLHLPYGPRLFTAWHAISDNGKLDGVRWLGRNDRYFLLTQLLHRKDALHPWLYARCREVELLPDGHLDLWAREHYKSTIITFAGTIQEILRDPEITVGIFSHTKPISRKFLLQIKEEFESNRELQRTYPDVLWADPRNEAPRWSEEKGIVVKRASNPRESTVEAHGLVDGQPTSAHFRLRVYDDVVTLESVSTPEQVAKTTYAWSISDNLGAKGADGKSRAWHIGTRYSFADTYQDILDLQALTPRIHRATDNGLPDGQPVFLTPEAWAEKRKNQLPAIIAAQMLQNPAAGNEAMFKQEWLKFAEVRPATLNVYILCDPASSRKKNSDNTAIPVIGYDAAHNKYLLDGYHQKMNLAERWTAISQLRKHWLNMPGVQMVRVGYERYGMQSDLEYFEEKMLATKNAFEIVELAWPREGPGSKYDRIQRLVPDFMNGRFFLAAKVDGETAAQRKVREAGQGFRIFQPTRRRDQDNNIYSLNKQFIETFLLYPFVGHEDLLDAVSRIYDIEPVPPIIIDERAVEPEVFADGV
jgi:hypothetical protein